jgi:hypothetical protein
MYVVEISCNRTRYLEVHSQKHFFTALGGRLPVSILLYKLALIPCGINYYKRSIKAGILRQGLVKSCHSFFLEQLPLLLVNR